MDVNAQYHTGPAEGDAVDYKDPCKAGNVQHATCIDVFIGREECGVLFLFCLLLVLCIVFVLFCVAVLFALCCRVRFVGLAVFCMTA